MSVLTVILLGIIQGITEFLPVSSSGHLVLIQTLFGLKTDSPEMLLFDLAVHLGTVVAVGVAFLWMLLGSRRQATAAGGEGQPTEWLGSVSVWRLLAMIVVATVATGVLVMPIKDRFEAAMGSVAVLAVTWLITGTLLWITDRKKQTRLDLAEFGLKGAFIVGLAQGVAVLPGISRSGATVCAAILLGLHRVRAVQFSLLIGIPAVLGASLVESLHNWEVIRSGSLPIGYLLLGAAVAAVVGVGAIQILVRLAKAAQFKYFGFYCYALGLFTLLYVLMH